MVVNTCGEAPSPYRIPQPWDFKLAISSSYGFVGIDENAGMTGNKKPAGWRAVENSVFGLN